MGKIHFKIDDDMWYTTDSENFSSEPYGTAALICFIFGIVVIGITYLIWG